MTFILRVFLKQKFTTLYLSIKVGKTNSKIRCWHFKEIIILEELNREKKFKLLFLFLAYFKKIPSLINHLK